MRVLKYTNRAKIQDGDRLKNLARASILDNFKCKYM
jgi:hypothetical protein